MHVLAEIDALDRATGNRVTLRAASGDLPELCGWGGRSWAPAIKDPGELAMKLFDGDFGSAPDVGGTSFSVSETALAMLYPQSPSYRFQGASLRLWTGLTPATIRPDPVFVGKVVKFESVDRLTKISADVDVEPLSPKVLDEYAGTGGLEGGADLKGALKPWALGRCLNISPALLDPVISLYQASAYGRIAAVRGVFDKAIDLGPTLGDYDISADLLAADIPAGRWATCLAKGLVRLGAPAYGKLTCDVDGDADGGVFPRRTGAILRRVALARGVPPELINDSFDTSDQAAAALPGGGTVNLYLTEQTTVLDLARRLFLPLNSIVGVAWNGPLFVSKVRTDAPIVTLDGQGRQLPEVFEFSEGDTLPPYKRVRMGARRSWTVQSLDEVAFYAPLVDRGRYDPAETYREGNIVDLADGSRWLFVAETPASAQEPSEGSAYWSVLSGPLTASLGDLTLDDIPDGASYQRPTPAQLDKLGGIEPGATVGMTAEEAARLTAARQEAYDAGQAAQAASGKADAATQIANSAILRLEGADNDGLIDINEKITIVIPESARLEGAFGSIVASADALGVDRTAVVNARATWINLRDSLSPAWNDITAASPVTRGSWDAALVGYDNAISDLHKAIAAKAAQTAEWAAVYGATKPENYATYGATADEAARLAAAKLAADEAIAAIDAIANDNLLSGSEKPALILRRNELNNRVAASRTTSLNLGNPGFTDPTAGRRQTLDNAVVAFNSYLDGLSPAWNDPNTDTPINGATLRDRFANVYAAIGSLDEGNLIEASTSAVWSKVGNDGARPDDFATYGATVTQAQYIAEARAALADIAADNTLAPSEKPDLIIRIGDLDKRVFAARQVSNNLVVPGVVDPTAPQRQAQETAWSDLHNYLNNRTPAWDQLGVATPITGSQLRLLFDNAYDKLSTLEQANVTVASKYAEWSKTRNDDGSRPENYATYGATAQQAADIVAAKATVDAITADNIIQRGQKTNLLQLINDVLNRVQASRVASVNLVIPGVLDPTNAQRAAMESQLTTFQNYLASLNPPYNDLSQDTPVDGPYLRDLFAQMYLKLADLDQGNTTAAARQATWGPQVVGAARPADYADVTVNQPIVSRLNASTGRVADPRMMSTNLLTGQRESTPLNPSYSVNGSSILVSLPSHPLNITGPSGPIGLSYGAMSFNVAPSSYWYAYVDDPNLTGISTPSPIVSAQAIDGQYPGRRRVAFGRAPALDGSGGSTGTGGGGTPPTDRN